MEDEKKPSLCFKFTYNSLFGTEFDYACGRSREEAEAAFWSGRTKELYRLFLTSCLGPCNFGDGERPECAECCNEERPSREREEAEQLLADEVPAHGGEVEPRPVGDGVCLACDLKCHPRRGAKKPLSKRLRKLLLGW